MSAVAGGDSVITPVPQWTTELREQRSGLDHLGLASVSNQVILARLVPDLFVLTRRPGYLSFYAFVLDEYWKRDDLPRSRAAWRDFFRTRDYIYSVACNACPHPDYSGAFGDIVGSQKTAALAAHPPAGGYRVDFPYIKNDFGGYGLYYRAIMVGMGLVHPSLPGTLPVDAPTDAGRELAAAFRQRIAGTDYWQNYFDQDVVPADVVAAYGAVACLCRLRWGPDLPSVREAILHDPRTALAADRRASLRMVLDLAAATVGHAVSEDTYRQLIYFGEADSGARWRPHPGAASPPGQPTVVETWRRWRLYQAREFYAFALNGLWHWLVEWGLEQQGDLRPIPIAEAISALRHILGATEGDPPVDKAAAAVAPDMLVEDSARELRRIAGDPAQFPDTDANWADRGFAIEAAVHEWILYRLVATAGAASDVIAWASLALLVLVATRFDHSPHRFRPDWEVARAGGVQRLSLDRYISLQRQYASAGLTVGELVARLIETYIVSQHLRTANSKLPYDTFRFVQEGRSLRFFDRSRPMGLNSARFNTLANTLSDLAFCGPLATPDHALTSEGFEFLETGDWHGQP
jgi:hypothetical protein